MRSQSHQSLPGPDSIMPVVNRILPGYAPISPGLPRLIRPVTQDDLTAVRGDLVSGITEVNAKIDSRIEQVMERLSGENKLTKEDKEELQQRISGLEQENDELRRANEAQKWVMYTAQQNWSEQTEQNNQRMSELANASQLSEIRAEKAEQEREALQLKFQQLKVERNSLKDQLKDLREQLSRAKDNQERLERERELNVRSKAEARDVRRQLEEDLEQRGAEVSELRAKLNKSRERERVKAEQEAAARAKEEQEVAFRTKAATEAVHRRQQDQWRRCAAPARIVAAALRDAAAASRALPFRRLAARQRPNLRELEPGLWAAERTVLGHDAGVFLRRALGASEVRVLDQRERGGAEAAACRRARCTFEARPVAVPLAAGLLHELPFEALRALLRREQRAAGSSEAELFDGSGGFTAAQVLLFKGGEPSGWKLGVLYLVYRN